MFRSPHTVMLAVTSRVGAFGVSSARLSDTMCWRLALGVEGSLGQPEMTATARVATAKRHARPEIRTRR
jgi:hypothetical protein